MARAASAAMDVAGLSQVAATGMAIAGWWGTTPVLHDGTAYWTWSVPGYTEPSPIDPIGLFGGTYGSADEALDAVVTELTTGDGCDVRPTATVSRRSGDNPVQATIEFTSLCDDSVVGGTYDVVGFHTDQPAQPTQLLGAGTEIRRTCPDRLDRRRDCERLAVTIGDAPAMGADLDHAAVARLALLLQEIVVESLQVERPPGEAQQPSEQNQQQHARAPDRKARHQHRACERFHFFPASCTGTST